MDSLRSRTSAAQQLPLKRAQGRETYAEPAKVSRTKDDTPNDRLTARPAGLMTFTLRLVRPGRGGTRKLRHDIGRRSRCG